MNKVKLLVGRLGSKLALGIVALTPITGQLHADNKEAQEAIEQAANAFQNAGVCAKVNWQADRLGYILINQEEDLQRALEFFYAIEIRKRYYDGAQMSFSDLRKEFLAAKQLAYEEFIGIARENFLGNTAYRSNDFFSTRE